MDVNKQIPVFVGVQRKEGSSLLFLEYELNGQQVCDYFRFKTEDLDKKIASERKSLEAAAGKLAENLIYSGHRILNLKTDKGCGASYADKNRARIAIERAYRFIEEGLVENYNAPEGSYIAQ